MTVTAFVITGNAKKVFAVLALRARWEREKANEAMRLLSIARQRESLNQCPVNDEARCDVPGDIPCARVCKVFTESIAKANEG